MEKDQARLVAKQNMNIARGKAVEAGVDPNKVIDSASQSETFGGKLTDIRNATANIKGKETAIINEVLTKIYGTIDKVLGGANVNKWINNAAMVKDSADQIQMYLNDFETYKTQPNALFGAVKALGRAIEPGLQVTAEEVTGFLGQNGISRVIGGAQELGEAFKAAFGIEPGKGSDAKLLRRMQEAAATNQPQIMWQILVQASNIISKAQENYGLFLTESKMNAENIGGQDIKTRTKYLPPEDREDIKLSVEQYINGKVPDIVRLSQMSPVQVGASMGDLSSQNAGAEAPAPTGETWDADFAPYSGQEKKAKQKQLVGQSIINRAAGPISDKATNDIVDGIFGE